NHEDDAPQQARCLRILDGQEHWIDGYSRELVTAGGGGRALLRCLTPPLLQQRSDASSSTLTSSNSRSQRLSPVRLPISCATERVLLLRDSRILDSRNNFDSDRLKDGAEPRNRGEHTRRIHRSPCVKCEKRSSP